MSSIRAKQFHSYPRLPSNCPSTLALSCFTSVILRASRVVSACVGTILCIVHARIEGLRVYARIPSFGMFVHVSVSARIKR
jgi:hypothetical protein